ncbi:hypothetical protein NKR23_g11779 [Pleurostoma richardsiae]|uniref:Uncharacterized protein n=1 Tax=Pleurostoma richardsiae TaxID=41990 RepID=A0AA38R756_9PEZI|nr:hypothetical protein NKR23_g11779 [Pleurostoma richardsiae]
MPTAEDFEGVDLLALLYWRRGCENPHGCLDPPYNEDERPEMVVGRRLAHVAAHLSSPRSRHDELCRVKLLWTFFEQQRAFPTRWWKKRTKDAQGIGEQGRCCCCVDETPGHAASEKIKEKEEGNNDADVRRGSTCSRDGLEGGDKDRLRDQRAFGKARAQPQPASSERILRSHLRAAARSALTASPEASSTTRPLRARRATSFRGRYGEQTLDGRSGVAVHAQNAQNASQPRTKRKGRDFEKEEGGDDDADGRPSGRLHTMQASATGGPPARRRRKSAKLQPDPNFLNTDAQSGGGTSPDVHSLAAFGELDRADLTGTAPIALSVDACVLIYACPCGALSAESPRQLAQHLCSTPHFMCEWCGTVVSEPADRDMCAAPSGVEKSSAPPGRPIWCTTCWRSSPHERECFRTPVENSCVFGCGFSGRCGSGMQSQSAGLARQGRDSGRSFLSSPEVGAREASLRESRLHLSSHEWQEHWGCAGCARVQAGAAPADGSVCEACRTDYGPTWPTGLGSEGKRPPGKILYSALRTGGDLREDTRDGEDMSIMTSWAASLSSSVREFLASQLSGDIKRILQAPSRPG